MNELISDPKISIGRRIVLTEDVCRHMNVDVGDRVFLIRNDAGEIVIKPKLAVIL